MPKPLIGLTTTRMPDPYGRPAHASSATYVNAVIKAGGIPILIPPDITDSDLDLLFRLDGVLFSGGYDINPDLYGGRPHPSIEGVDDSRDQLERHMVLAAAQSGKPFLGICRGIQIINVALGGDLYDDLLEHLPGSLQHENHKLRRDYLAHRVSIETNSQLLNILASNQVQVNSLHHQGIRKLGDGLKVSASAPDGLIEAVELAGHPFGLGVQWHPEELQEDPAMCNLFQTFITACERKGQK